MLPCSLHSALPKQSFLLLQLFCQAIDLHEGANHSNIDGSCMNVQHDLTCVTRFQSHLSYLKYLWFNLSYHYDEGSILQVTHQTRSRTLSFGKLRH